MLGGPHHGIFVALAVLFRHHGGEAQLPHVGQDSLMEIWVDCPQAAESTGVLSLTVLQLDQSECSGQSRHSLDDKGDLRILLEAQLHLFHGDLVTREEEVAGDGVGVAGAAKHFLLVLLQNFPHVVIRVLEQEKSKSLWSVND